MVAERGSEAQPADGDGADFFVSYASADRAWAEWIAWQLEDAGYRVLIQAWDFGAGTHFVEEMHRAAKDAARTIAVLSTAYLRSAFAQPEWQAAWAADPSGRRRRLLIFRVEDCDRPGLLGQIVSEDLFGLDRASARDRLLAAARNTRGKPAFAPDFPGSRPVGGEPAFPGAVSVRDADPRRLGVHPAISAAGVPDSAPPAYVLRDIDTAEFGLRARLRTAAVRSGFVLLVGGSSVGKTRSAVEAIKEVLPDWWLIHPAGPGEVVALARQPPVRTVIWLDELQRYLDGTNGLTGGTIRALLNAPGPLVLIGTLWPDRYSAYTALPAADRDDREREVLDLADTVRVGEEFSAAEQGRAREVGKHDERIAAALNTNGYRLAQTLAAAPELVAHWDNAKTAEPYAWAVLTAALDAACLGIHAPLAADLLRAAAPGYLTSRQRALAPADWFDNALAYATRTLRGAAAALDPVSAEMGRVAGYTPADYLVQHAIRERVRTRIPASTWEALAAATFDRDDTLRLAGSADSLLRYSYAIPLYRRLYDAGETAAGEWLVQLLADRGDADGLRALAEAGNAQAATWLASVTDHDPDGVVGRLVDSGNADSLRKLAAAGNWYAAERLAFLLAERGEIADLVEVLDGRAGDGDRDAREQLVFLLLEHRDWDRLRALAADGTVRSWDLIRLVDALVALGEQDRLRELAGDGHRYATQELASLLHNRADRDGLRELTLTADYDDFEWLAGLLEDLGDLDGAAELRRINELRSWAYDKEAIEELANLLHNRADRDHLRKLALSVAVYYADPEWLADLLADLGDLDGAADVRRMKGGPRQGHWIPSHPPRPTGSAHDV